MRRTLIVLVGLALLTVSCGDDQGGDPIEIVKAFDAANNAGDVDAMMALVSDDATFSTGAGTFQGKDEIRSWAQYGIDEGITVETSDYQRNGGEVTWVAVLNLPDGNQISIPTTVTIEDGKIKTFVEG